MLILQRSLLLLIAVQSLSAFALDFADAKKGQSVVYDGDSSLKFGVIEKVNSYVPLLRDASLTLKLKSGRLFEVSENNFAHAWLASGCDKQGICVGNSGYTVLGVENPSFDFDFGSVIRGEFIGRGSENDFHARFLVRVVESKDPAILAGSLVVGYPQLKNKNTKCTDTLCVNDIVFYE